ncbi:putative ribonuclease H-like domain-containing protein [Tanacetum coccineum]
MLALKYQEQPSSITIDKKTPPPKRVHFINTITLVKKERESRDSTPREHEGLTCEVDDEVGSNELQEEEENDLEYFNMFPSMKELKYHEWLLKNPRPPWVFDNQSIERDRLIGIGFVLGFVEFISFTFSDKETILVIEAVMDQSTEESIGECHSSKETGSSQDYILMPLWKDGSLSNSSLKNAKRSKNSTQDVNTVGPSINTASTNINTGCLNINIVSPTVTTAPVEAIHADFFSDETEVDMSNITTTYPVPSTPNIRIHKDHSLDHVIGDVQSGVQTRRMTKTIFEQGIISAVYKGKTHEDLHTCLFACFLSQEEPKKVIQALKDPSWIEAIQEELLQFKLQQVWTLIDLPHGKRAIGTKWVYRNKKDEKDSVIRNKARQVTQGYTQEEGIYYDEVFALVARIEAIRLFLAYASFKDFVVYQMDVKSAFLYGKIEEEVYVCQPPGFEDPEFPDRVYKVEKALYGLRQAPRSWYETFSTYLLNNGFHKGQIDKTLFFKSVKSDILLVQVYVDDIIFGSTKKELCTKFKKLMHKKFQMSLCKYTYGDCLKPLMKEEKAEDFTPKVLHLHAVKRIFRYLKGQPKLGLWYSKDSPFDLEAYTDTNYAGASLDRKSITGVSVTVSLLWIVDSERDRLIFVNRGTRSVPLFVDRGTRSVPLFVDRGTHSVPLFVMLSVTVSTWFDVIAVMELENSQNNALAKLPMLKLGEYEMREIRIKQYFQI